MILTEKLFDLMQSLKGLRDRSDKIMSYYQGGKQLSERFMALSKMAASPHVKSGERPDVTDYSLRTLLLRHFRRYGKPSRDYSYYGMRVSTKESPSSRMILLGRNGVGKSSLFDAAEYLFTGSIGEADYRRIKPRNFIHDDAADQEIAALTGSGFYSKTNPPRVAEYLPVGNFFVSENSIVKSLSMIQDGNFYPFLCEMLGLGDIYELSKGNLLDEMIDIISSTPENKTISSKEMLDDILYSNFFTLRENDGKELESYRESLFLLLEKCRKFGTGEITLEQIIKEAYKINMRKHLYITPVSVWYNTLDRIRQQAKYLKAKRPRQTSKSFPATEAPKYEEQEQELVVMLHSAALTLISYFDSVTSRMDGKDLILELKRRLDQYLHDEEEKDLLSLKGSDEVAQFKDDLTKSRNELGSSLSEYIATICDEKLVSSIKEVFDSTFIDSKDETFDIDISHISEGIVTMTVNGVPANRYFNTFRFRLLFIVLQTSLCIRLMKFTKVSFPIFFDDVFYANDYNNKQELVKFFRVLSKQSEDITKDGIPFQYLFFSHDEQLVYALSNDKGEKKDDKSVQVVADKYCRILDVNTLNIAESTHDQDTYEGQTILFKNVYVQIFA